MQYHSYLLNTKSPFLKLLVPFFVLLALSCSGDDASQEQELVNSLLGAWEEVAPCASCLTVTFKDGHAIELKFASDPELYTMSYTVNDNALFVTRNWNVGNDRESNRVEINFQSKDSLELFEFKATDAASTTGYEDILLKRL